MRERRGTPRVPFLTQPAEDGQQRKAAMAEAARKVTAAGCAGGGCVSPTIKTHHAASPRHSVCCHCVHAKRARTSSLHCLRCI